MSQEQMRHESPGRGLQLTPSAPSSCVSKSYLPNHVPVEMVAAIVSFLPSKEQLVLLQTCRQLHSITRPEMLKQNARGSASALHWACKNGDLALVDHMLDLGVDPDIRFGPDVVGTVSPEESSSHSRKMNYLDPKACQIPLTVALYWNEAGVVRRLLTRGATARGHPDMALCMLDTSLFAEVAGLNPLACAILVRSEHVVRQDFLQEFDQIIELLLEHGASARGYLHTTFRLAHVLRSLPFTSAVLGNSVPVSTLRILAASPSAKDVDEIPDHELYSLCLRELLHVNSPAAQRQEELRAGLSPVVTAKIVFLLEQRFPNMEATLKNILFDYVGLSDRLVRIGHNTYLSRPRARPGTSRNVPWLPPVVPSLAIVQAFRLLATYCDLTVDTTAEDGRNLLAGAVRWLIHSHHDTDVYNSRFGTIPAQEEMEGRWRAMDDNARQIFDLLLDAGLGRTSRNAFTALHQLCGVESAGIKSQLHHRADIQAQLASFIPYFIERGVLIDARDPYGCTALHYAIQCGFQGQVKQLLNSQPPADLCARDHGGRSPLDIPLGMMTVHQCAAAVGKKQLKIIEDALHSRGTNLELILEENQRAKKGKGRAAEPQQESLR